MEDLSIFGERLTELMFEKNNISSKSLAELIGISYRSVNRWKSGKALISYNNLIKIADIFECSLEFLFGRSENKIDFVPKPALPFYERLRAIMSEKSISWYKLVNESNINDSNLYLWSKGSMPLIPTLIELADYLKCTTDYLVGRER